MSWTILSPVIIVGVALLLMGLERLFPYAPQKLLRTGFFTDLLAYGVLQSYVLGFAISAVIRFVDHHTGWSKLGPCACEPGTTAEVRSRPIANNPSRTSDGRSSSIGMGADGRTAR